MDPQIRSGLEILAIAAGVQAVRIGRVWLREHAKLYADLKELERIAHLEPAFAERVRPVRPFMRVRPWITDYYVAMLETLPRERALSLLDTIRHDHYQRS